MSNYSPMGGGHPVGDVLGKVPTSVTVTTSSTQLLAADEDRRFVMLSNIGNKDAFVAAGQTALVSKGGVILKGESLVIGLSEESSKEDINAIVIAGDTVIAILEFN